METSQRRPATVDILITRGPSVPKEAVLPPYAPDCEDPIINLNWMDIDDLSLSPLAHKLSQVRPFSCFDEDAMKKDEDRLKKSGALESVAYSTFGAKGDREVSLKLRGKPMPVKSIALECYGNASGCDHPAPNLPLRAGTIYTRSADHQASKVLKQAFSKPGQIVEVLEDADLNADGTATIRFEILSYDTDRIFVDGQEVISGSSN